MLIKRIVDSEPVRTQYPGLYDKIERYLEALVEEQQRDTRIETLSTINGLIDDVLAGGDGYEAVSAAFSDSGERDALLGLIDRLKKLLGEPPYLLQTDLRT